MENGGGNHLENKLASLGLNDSDNNNGDGLFQVIKAVEAAEVTIKEQVEENNRLRSELQKKIAELETYKSQSDEHVSQIVSNIRSQKERKSDEHEGKKVNGASALRVVPGQVATENYGFSQLSSPSMTSFSPIRYQAEGESDRRLTLSGQGLMTLSDLSSASLKEDLGSKIREFEEEIMQLKKHLSEYSVKEAQIHNDKHVLEKRIAYMRMAFDQQQQDLVDAASKAISYRQDIIEENIRLTYALQDAQQERSAFVSTLMPLLAEYSLQPPVSNAQSIVSNVKVLFRHLHEKLMLTEAKLKESQYQMLPWRSDMNNTNVTNSPSHVTGMKDGLELVTQQAVTGAYQDGNQPISPDPPQGRRTTIWGDAQNNNINNNNNNSNISVAPKSPEQDDLWRYSPISSRETVPQNIPVDHGRKNEETNSKQVTFGDLVSNSDIDDNEIERQQSDVDPTWTPTKTSPYNNNNNTNSTPDEPSTSYSPYLPPVLEEPNSSYSEAADDDPLPGIEGLQISGEAFPGRELQACGYSVNGTTSCNFEWVRHLEDGSFNYIDGAKQPNYLVTADDVDTHLAIEVQPLDNRKRKGELVKVFTNDHRKITCDQEMHNCIARTANSGHASYKVSLSMGYIDMWEPATLSIKKDGYSIKGSGASGVIVSEKYSQSTIVSIPFGSVMEFSILDSQGVDRLLRAENSSTDVSCSRDTIVLTLRLFILRAIVKKKSKKRGLFFTK